MILKYEKIFRKLGNIQKESIKNLIYKNNKIIKYIGRIFPIYHQEKKIEIKYHGINIKKIKKKKTRETKSILLKIKIEINSYKKNNIILRRTKKYIEILKIPYPDKNSEFIINKINRTIILQLRNKKGFNINKERNTINLYPNRGKKTTFKIIRDNILIKGKKGKLLNVNILLQALGVKTKDISNNLIKHKEYIIVKGKLYTKSSINKNNKYIQVSKNTKQNQFILAEEINTEKIKIKKFSRLNIKKIKKIKDTIKIKIFEFTKIKNLIQNNIESIYLGINKSRQIIVKNTINKNQTKNPNIMFYKMYMNINNYRLSRYKNNKKIFTPYSYKIIKEMTKIISNKKKLKSINNEIDRTENKRVFTLLSIFREKIKNSLKILKTNIEPGIKKKYNLKKITNRIKNNYMNNKIKEFFYTSNLSQYSEQNNLISRLSHKRRITALRENNKSSKNPSMDIRKINISQYGKICPIETPEGCNIGLVNSITIGGKIIGNKIYTPYIKNNLKKNNKINFISNIIEKNKIIKEPYYKIKKNFKTISRRNNKLLLTNKNSDYNTLCEIQNFSTTSSLIPFIQYNDANRALMAISMLKQAVPCIKNKPAKIHTGMDKTIINSSIKKIKKHINESVIYTGNGTILTIENNNNKKVLKEYTLKKFTPTNQYTLYNEVLSNKKECLKNILNKTNTEKKNRISIGNDIFTIINPWKGHNFEDSIVISRKIQSQDNFTSIHINKIKITVNKNKEKTKIISKKIIKPQKYEYNKIAKNGIIKEGSYIKEGDILACIIKKKIKEKDITTKLFEYENNNYEENFYRAPYNIEGKIIAIKINKTDNNKEKKNIYKKYTKKILEILKKKCNKKELEYKRIIYNNRVHNKIKIKKKRKKKLIKSIELTIASTKKINVGDKISGRYGNKGVISKIIEEEDMPFLKNGKTSEIIINPIGIPSRMNIGQIYEINIGMLIYGIKKNIQITKKNNILHQVKKKFNLKKKGREIYINFPPFEKIKHKNINKIAHKIINKKIKKNLGCNATKLKSTILNSLNGEKIKNKITTGYMYFIKLNHIAVDKIHARSTGPYSIITQQPLKGKSNKGGQRIGEMEVWALEAYGASYTLYEMMTIKSDCVKSRKKTIQNIIENKEKIIFDIPESFKVLINELKSVCIKVNIK